MHPQLRKLYVLWVVPLSCILTPVYHLIVKSMCAFVHRYLLLLWSVKPFYSGITRRNKLQYLVHFQDWVKAVVLHRSIANLAFALFYLEVLPFLCQDCHENCTTSYEFLTQWILLAIIIHSSVPCYCNRNTDKRIVMCEIYTPSNSVAW